MNDQSTPSIPVTTETIGDIIRHNNQLDADQIQNVLQYQRKHGVKFGEAAVALGFATRDDVLWALSQQFNYSYTHNTTLVNNAELVTATAPFSEEAEFFRDIRTQLLNGIWNAPESVLRPRALAVVSPAVGDGKSFLAANLAIAFSQLGERTLLVDADMRTPRQHAIFDIKSPTGLSSILSGRSEPSVIQPVTTLQNLFVLPVGITPPNPLELLQLDVFPRLIADLGRKFSYVIVDTPAADHGADARVIARHCGGALVVARKNRAKLNQLKTLTKAISKAAPLFAGVIMNDY